jgi:Cysteine dioxygenase type I
MLTESRPLVSVRPPVLARAPLNLIELVDYARLFADEVSAGRYPYVQFDADNRWHQRLYRDQRLDIWLISWLPTQETQLHDHGGSAGAFAVLSGELSEAVYRRDPAGGALPDHRRSAGTAIGFGPRYVHDVRNRSDAPAVSVHAYSPPLTSMTFYDVDEAGELERLARVATDDPEPDLGPDLGAHLDRAQRSQPAGATTSGGRG